MICQPAQSRCAVLVARVVAAKAATVSGNIPQHGVVFQQSLSISVSRLTNFRLASSCSRIWMKARTTYTLIATAFGLLSRLRQRAVLGEGKGQTLRKLQRGRGDHKL